MEYHDVESLEHMFSRLGGEFVQVANLTHESLTHRDDGRCLLLLRAGLPAPARARILKGAIFDIIVRRCREGSLLDVVALLMALGAASAKAGTP